MSWMAEVLRKHHADGGYDYDLEWQICTCGTSYAPRTHDTHLEAELVAAGFGPVKEAAAKALEEAAAVIESRATNFAGFWVGKEITDLANGSWSAMRHEARTIRARAAAVRSEG